MIKATLTLLAVVTLAACEATMTDADPMAEQNDRPAEAADPAQGQGGAPWWSV